MKAITNKQIAFYIAILATILAFGLMVTNQITVEQAKVLIIAIGAICAAFGLSDVGYDYLNTIFRVAEIAASFTPSPDDDKQVAELKQLVIANEVDIENNEPAEAVG